MPLLLVDGCETAHDSFSRGRAIRFSPPIWLWACSRGVLAGESFVGVGVGGHGAL